MDARSSYREATARGASPVQLVILLYEQAIEDLRRAVLALEKGDIEARTCSLNHALMVIGQLQARSIWSGAQTSPETCSSSTLR